MMNRNAMSSGLRSDRANSTAVTDWMGRASTIATAGTSLGIGGATTTLQQERADDNNRRLVLTLTGWRRRCLFGLLLTLTVVVIINLSLTLWLLRSMQFSLVPLDFSFVKPCRHKQYKSSCIYSSHLSVLLPYRKAMTNDLFLLFTFSCLHMRYSNTQIRAHYLNNRSIFK